MSTYFKVRLENGEFWTEDEQDMKFTDVSVLIEAVDDFISDTTDAAILEFLSEPYDYDEIEVVHFDANKVATVYSYPDFIANFDLSNPLSVGQPI